MRKIVSDIQDENGLFFAVYVQKSTEPLSNEEAAEFLADENHLDGQIGDYWSGTHPKFNKQHAYPFTAVIDLATGEVINTDPIPEILSPDDVMDAVKEANRD